MNTSLATKRVPEVSPRLKSGMLVVFYLLTFLTEDSSSSLVAGWAS